MVITVRRPALPAVEIPTATPEYPERAIARTKRILDLDSFRRWTADDDVPETGQDCFLDGEVWNDMSKEQLFSHNQVKTKLTLVLAGLVKTQRLGRDFHDGAFLSNVDASVSNQPDGTFVSLEAASMGRVRIVEGATDGHAELEGSPDLVVEVGSRSSVEKDTEVLRDSYATAASANIGSSMPGARWCDSTSFTRADLVTSPFQSEPAGHDPKCQLDRSV